MSAVFGVAYVPLVVSGAVGPGGRGAVEQGLEEGLEAGEAGCYDGRTDLDGCPGDVTRGSQRSFMEEWGADVLTRWSDLNCQTGSRRVVRSW